VGTRLTTILAALATALSATFPALSAASDPPVRRPVSLISSRLLMVQGRPAVPVADLARALGGVLNRDETTGVYRIQPGATDLLRFDAAGRGVPAGHGRHGAARDAAVPQGDEPQQQSLYIGAVHAAQRLIVQGREPYLLLDELAEMFGGAAAFDASLGQWFIVGAQPGRVLAFR